MNQQDVNNFIHTADRSGLIKALNHKNVQVRKLAAQRIGVMRNPADIPHLIESLTQEQMRMSKTKS